MLKKPVGGHPPRTGRVNHTKYKLDQIDREVFVSTLDEVPVYADFSALVSTSDPVC